MKEKYIKPKIEIHYILNESTLATTSAEITIRSASDQFSPEVTDWLPAQEEKEGFFN